MCVLGMGEKKAGADMQNQLRGRRVGRADWVGGKRRAGMGGPGVQEMGRIGSGVAGRTGFGFWSG